MSELEGYKSVQFWRGRIAPGTFRTYINAFGVFMRWLRENGGALADLDPDGLIDYQKTTDNGSKFDLLDLVQTWSQNLRTPDGRDYRLSSKHSAYSAVRSFFQHNRGGLPRDTYTFRSETEDSEGKLTIEHVRDTALASTPMYRAVFLSMFQGALDLQSFLYWNERGWEELETELRDPYLDTVKIRIPGRKSNRQPFYTFIGGDAIKAIRDYVPKRPTREEAQGKHERDEARRRAQAEEEGKKYVPRPCHYAIFYTRFKTPISRVALQHYWLARLEDLGLVVRETGRGVRYGMNLHELRDVFRSQWEKSPAKASAGEYMMGHKIDPLEYNKAYKDEDWARDQYLLALPMLEIMSTARPYGLVKISAKQATFQDEFQGLLEDPEIRESFLRWLAELKRE